MNRVALHDGRWFDKDSAKVFEAAYLDNGNPDSPYCLATGNDWSGEALYLTERGTLILHSFERIAGNDHYSEIDIEAAARWLIANGHQQALTQLELHREEADLQC